MYSNPEKGRKDNPDLGINYWSDSNFRTGTFVCVLKERCVLFGRANLLRNTCPQEWRNSERSERRDGEPGKLRTFWFRMRDNSSLAIWLASFLLSWLPTRRRFQAPLSQFWMHVSHAQNQNQTAAFLVRITQIIPNLSIFSDFLQVKSTSTHRALKQRMWILMRMVSAMPVSSPNLSTRHPQKAPISGMFGKKNYPTWITIGTICGGYFKKIY